MYDWAMTTASVSNREILSVSDLNRQVRHLLEGEFSQIFVEGEISNLARPASGHIYFTLKDAKAQLKCAMFRNRNQHLKFKPRDGGQVIVRGRVSLYEGRGDFQLIVDGMEESGEGALRRAFEKLKLKLQDEGLFEEEYKINLPAMPKHLGIITSPTGAAVRDVLHVLERRFPSIRTSIIPVQVQGEDSPQQVSRAIEIANDYEADPFDLLLLTRGGGSLEDLWTYNTELVARAIFSSRIPIISAIGHETDFSISDYVADLRAPTPSAAAEMLSPDQTEWIQTFQRYQSLLQNLMDGRLTGLSERQNHLSRRLRNPLYRLQDYQQRVDDYELRLVRLTKHRLQGISPEVFQQRMQRAVFQRIEQLKLKLSLQQSQLSSPQLKLENLKLRLEQIVSQLDSIFKSRLIEKKQNFSLLLQKLDSLSPLATLQRGYAIVTRGDSSTQVIKNAEDIDIGEKITARLMKGRISAQVTKRYLDDDE